MPLTPYHFGPAFLVGLVLLSYIDFPTFMIASVIVDVEPAFILFLRLNFPLHGFFHSFMGGTLVALALAAVMTKIRKRFSGLLSLFRLERQTSTKGIFAAALLGVYIHLLLDSTMHADMPALLSANHKSSSGTRSARWADGYNDLRVVFHGCRYNLRSEAVFYLAGTEGHEEIDDGL
jgi:membrane-bound metal-dependent hydrolase YbcI (DUF457 family)